MCTMRSATPSLPCARWQIPRSSSSAAVSRKRGEMLVEGVKKGFLKYVFYPNTDVRFNLAVLGNDAGIYGCCKLLLDSLA